MVMLFLYPSNLLPVTMETVHNIGPKLLNDITFLSRTKAPCRFFPAQHQAPTGLLLCFPHLWYKRTYPVSAIQPSGILIFQGTVSELASPVLKCQIFSQCCYSVCLLSLLVSFRSFQFSLSFPLHKCCLQVLDVCPKDSHHNFFNLNFPSPMCHNQLSRQIVESYCNTDLVGY